MYNSLYLYSISFNNSMKYRFSEGDILVLELKEFFTRYTNDVIATTAFGIGVDSLRQPKNEFFIKGQEATNFGPWRFIGLLAFPKLMLVGNIDNFVYLLII